MEGFLIYIIVCISSMGGCTDYAPRKPFLFLDKRECMEYTSGLYVRFVNQLREKSMVVVDGKYFCLRFKIRKEA